MAAGSTRKVWRLNEQAESLGVLKETVVDGR